MNLDLSIPTQGLLGLNILALLYFIAAETWTRWRERRADAADSPMETMESLIREAEAAEAGGNPLPPADEACRSAAAAAPATRLETLASAVIAWMAQNLRRVEARLLRSRARTGQRGIAR